MPTLGSYIQRQVSTATTLGTTQGNKMPARKKPSPRTRWFSSSASASPSTICATTLAPTHSPVLRSAIQNTGSAHMRSKLRRPTKETVPRLSVRSVRSWKDATMPATTG